MNRLLIFSGKYSSKVVIKRSSGGAIVEDVKVVSGSEQDGQHKTLEREGWDSLDICRREMVTLLDKGD